MGDKIPALLLPVGEDKVCGACNEYCAGCGLVLFLLLLLLLLVVFVAATVFPFPFPPKVPVVELLPPT